MAGNFAGGGAQVALLAALSRVVLLAWAFAVHSVCPAYDTSTAAAAAAYAGPGACPAL